MTLKILRNEDYKITDWAGGKATQVFLYPENSTLRDKDFIFRVSSVTMTNLENIFTKFQGYNRYILSTDDILKLENKGNLYEIKPYEIFFFDGADETKSYTKVSDFNLILKKGVQGSMRAETIESDEITFKAIEEINLIYFPENGAKVVFNGESTLLNPLDSILLVDKNYEFTIQKIDNKPTKVIIVEVEVD